MPLPRSLRAVALLAVIAVAAFAIVWSRAPSTGPSRPAVLGEARRGSMSVALPAALADVAVTEARGPGRPLVVIDPGHGGRDPGATGADGRLREKELTLLVARELRARLARAGRVRVALTRDGDDSLELDTRGEIARRLGADLFVSLHADSARVAGARGATVYSLSEVASDADAARLAAAAGTPNTSTTEGSVRALLADLAMRESMEGSADFAVRLLGRAGAGVEWRPEPHRFAAFRVLRRAEAPAVLFEMGYLSSVDDEARLRDPVRRARMVEALAGAIETEMALRRPRRGA